MLLRCGVSVAGRVRPRVREQGVKGVDDMLDAADQLEGWWQVPRRPQETRAQDSRKATRGTHVWIAVITWNCNLEGSISFLATQKWPSGFLRVDKQ